MFLFWTTLSRRHDVGFPASQRHNIIYNDITPNPSKGSNQSRLNLIDIAVKFHQDIFIISNWVVVRTRIIWKMRQSILSNKVAVLKIVEALPRINIH